MSAVMVETVKEAARRLAAPAIRIGYLPVALHCYEDADGNPVFWRIRAKHPDGRKWIRPMQWTGSAFIAGEPAKPDAGKVLYRLPQLIAADASLPVLVVEGESCADALAALGIVVTTSGAADSAKVADWSPLQGRTVRVWADNDAAGATYADNVAIALHALGCIVERIDIQHLELPDKGDAVDWLAAHPDATAADVLGLASSKVEASRPANKIGAGNWLASAPEPLRRALPPADPYPMDALGDVLGNAAKAIHRNVQSPAGMCGQSILSAASLAVQAHADVVIDGRREPLSLWHVTVGDSGERKSGGDRWALQAHREHEQALWMDCRHAMTAFDFDDRSYKAAARKAESGKKDALAIRDAIRELGAPPEPPLSPLLLVPEATLEGLHKLLQTGRPSMGLFNDDAGDFLDGHAMSRDNRTKSAAGLSKLWDNGEFSRIRAGDGASKFYGRRLAMHVMVQPVIAERVLSDDVLCGQGFLPRCLLSWPTSTAGTRRYMDTDLTADPALRAYWARMSALLTLAPPLQADTRNELAPRALGLTADAKARWIAVANAIETDLLGDFGSVKAWASKGASQVLRVAGVLTLVEDHAAALIGLDAIDRAAVLVDHYLSEAVRIVGASGVPVHVRHAELLRGWCWETRRELLFSSDAMRLGPNAVRSVDAFDKAVEVLEANGWAAYVEGGMHIDGKQRARVWQMRPQGDD